MRISIVMPAYNEENNIKKTVSRCLDILSGIQGDHEVIIVNDGSRDDTGRILSEIVRDDNRVVVLENSPNQGYGAAMARAMMKSSGDIVVSIDSDGQFDIGDLPTLLPQFTSETDVLTGYRRMKKDTLFRVIGDRIMNLMIRCMFHVPFKDTNCALKLYRGSFLRSMNLEARGFQLPTEIVLKAHFMGKSVREAPVHHRLRAGGTSTLAPIKTAWQMFVFLLYLRIKASIYQHGIIGNL